MSIKLSLENRLLLLFSFSVILPLIPCFYIINISQLDLLESATLLLAILLPSSWIFYRCFHYITDVIDRIGLQLDSLGNEEYNSWHLAGFRGGRINSLKDDFIKIAKKMAAKRLEYMHNESFLFDFIKDLELPIVVLDNHEQIYMSNSSFNKLLNTSKNQLVGKHVRSLGFAYNEKKWCQLPESRLSQRYEITPHIVKRSGRNYQLLVLFSIEQQLRDNEKQVWQRLIRVLNHEVRNSLTPIYSMTQSLQEMKLSGPLKPAQEQLEKNILQVIEKRSLQLLEFVENYSAFNKLSPPNIQQVSSTEINQRIVALFPIVRFEQEDIFTVKVDLGQLEQALINLIKNAIEATKDNLPVIMRWSQDHYKTVLEILDTGSGIANSDNLFVPFYSTKEKGTGIGLILSREYIRNQGGDLTLANRNDSQGVVATLTFPRKTN